MTKVTIVSGFLGAGKTTLIKKLLKEAYENEQIVLIENEFGEIGIDGGFMKDAGVMVSEMNSGCICCTLVGDFATSLKEVITTYSPDRIIIEPSGVGKLSDVINAVEGVKEECDLELTGTVAVVDGKKAKMYLKNFGEFFENQVEYAGTICMSRTKVMNEDALKKAVELLREHNDKAHIITTDWDKIDGKRIVSVMEENVDLVSELMKDYHHEDHSHCDHEHGICHHEHHDHHDHSECDHEHGICHHEHEHHHEHDHDHEHCHEHEHDHDYEHCHEHEHHDHAHHHDEHCCHEHGHHHHHADEVFSDWGVETTEKYSKDELENILEGLSKGDFGFVLRAKGVVEGTDGSWYEFDMVPEEYEVRAGHADYTGRICVIGTKLDKEKIKELFHA